MEKNEFENWTKVRKHGAWKYALKNASIALILVFCIYFFGNMYTHRERIDFYIYSFKVEWIKNLVTLIIVFMLLVPLNLFLWKFNEKRYKAAEEKSEE